MRPHSYTELFFLDEATAFAAGHRPCAECRHADYQRFRAAWARAHGTPAGADQMDAGAACGPAGGDAPKQRQRIHRAEIASQPSGTFIELDGAAWLLWHAHLLAWSAAGYTVRRPAPRTGVVAVVTPAALVAVLRAGYVPGVHPSAEDGVALAT